MGIRGLFNFVRARPKQHVYVRREIRGDLVIDGSQFCYYYYKQLDRVNGGQYPEFHQKVSAFFHQLQQCGITSHVVFEGIDKSQKLTDEYILRRKTERHERTLQLLQQRPYHSTAMPELPHLAYTVLVNVLAKMCIPSYVGDGEGDESCVQIANSLKCPVLSNDSDFYLFNIHGGYIELGHVQTQLQGNPQSLSVDVYSREAFMRCCFRENNIDGLYLLSVIMDRLDEQAIVQYIESKVGRRGNIPPIEWIYSYLSRSESIRDEMEKIALTKEFESVKAYYNPAPQNPDELHSKPINFDLPEWFLRQHRNHTMPYMLVDALVNRKQHHSSSPVCLHIRQCCYSILGVPQVKEYCIEGDWAVSPMVPCADALQPCYRISELPQVGERERKSLLFSILRCSQDQLEGIGDREKLLVCSVIFWKEETRPPTHVVKALLGCFILLSFSSDENVRRVRKNECRIIPERYRKSDNWLRDRQSFLDWQCVYKEGITLRSLLQCPAVEICPSKVYDGKIVMSLASQLDRIDSVIQQLGISMEKYYKFLQIVNNE